MKTTLKIAGCILLTFFLIPVQAQVTETTTEPIQVSFKKIDHPLKVQLTKPEGFDVEDKSRGFKTVKVRKTIFEGYITDLNGLSQAVINGKTVQLMPDGYFSIELSFAPGDNELQISAIDNDGFSGFKSYPFRIREETSLVVGNYHALIIGVEDYLDDQIVDLDRPISDAVALKNVLVDKYTFVEENITLLKNATRRNIIDALDKLSQSIGENDNLLIFYAGHGYWNDETKTGYWIPSDGHYESTADWFRNSTLTDQIGSINSKHTLLIADACFSGSIFKSRSFFADADKSTNLKYSLPSRKAMTSGTLTDVPDESVFLKYLIKRLNENENKYLAANNLFFSLEEAVINNSDINIKPQYGTIQKVGDEGGDFIFILNDQGNP